MNPSELTKEQLADALSKDEFLFFYQPILSCNTGKYAKAEALIRWQRDGQLIPPGDFIPFAEETDFITEITISMLHHFFTDVSKIHEIDDSVRIALNVSARDITSPSFLEAFLTALKDSNCDADKIFLELTESAALTLDKESLLIVTELVVAGVRLVIDDFGTGNATFQKLRDLPFSVLKIDRSITAGALGSADGLTLLDHSINLAHQLKLETVVEGVESDELYRYITTTGCDYVQGFLISHPLALPPFLEFIQEEAPWASSHIGNIYKARIDYIDWMRRVFGMLLLDSTQQLIDIDHTASPFGTWLYSGDTELRNGNHDDLNTAYRRSHELAIHLLNAKTYNDNKLINDLLPDFLNAISIVNTMLHDLYVNEYKKQIIIDPENDPAAD